MSVYDFVVKANNGEEKSDKVKYISQIQFHKK